MLRKVRENKTIAKNVKKDTRTKRLKNVMWFDSPLNPSLSPIDPLVDHPQNSHYFFISRSIIGGRKISNKILRGL